MAFDKEYNTDTCDLLIAALSNRTGATMTIYQYREESKRHAPITPKAWRLDVIPMYTSTWHEEESDSVLTCDREIWMPGGNCVPQTYITLLVYVYMCWKFLCGPTLWRNVETMLSNWGALSRRRHYLSRLCFIDLNFCHWLLVCVATTVIMVIQYTTW